MKNNIHVLSRGVIIDQDHILLCKTLDLPISFYFLPGGHDDGILASYSTFVYQDGNESPTKVSKGYENTLQVYGSAELQALLKENGFIVLAQTDINGEGFSKENSDRILTIAKKA